jgi:hypothetical protein
MSEYQYYEFRAVDKPLTPQQQAELRSRDSLMWVGQFARKTERENLDKGMEGAGGHKAE